MGSDDALYSGEELLAARTSLRHVATHLLRASAGLTVALIVARVIVDLIDSGSLSDRWYVVVEIVIQVVAAGVALTLTSAIPIAADLRRVKKAVSRNERQLEQSWSSQRFLRDVQIAFEMADNKDELFEITGVALGDIAHDELGGTEILVADSSGSHVTEAVVATVGSAPGCGVTTPGGCPAVRRGQTLEFKDPQGLASCPRLRERDLPAGTVATCVPVTVLGTPSAVMHATYSNIDDQATLDEKVDLFEGVAAQFGTRLGMIQAMSRSQLQADTDPLTGLLNRRAMENQVRELRSHGHRFALAMLDLDNFKNLNDTFGHDTGDRALRLFARVLATATRDNDLVCRYGGEEFVVVLPDASVADAALVFHRLRASLALEVADSQVPPFTVSVGLCDSGWADDLQDLLSAADQALMEAKAQGRDQLVISEPAPTPTPTPSETFTIDVP